MKILITGAGGFIGSYLADYLKRKGHEVMGASRKELDVLNTEQLNAFSVNADAIVHTATANDIISKNALKGIELSGIGTKNILDLAVRNKIPKCIVFSTLQVYGTELLGKIDENSPLQFQNDYGLNHLVAEMYAEQYARQGKVKTVTVRPSNVYGRILTNSFDRWSLVPGCFCKEALESGTITIKSSGKQMRNFVNLENLSRGVEAILNHFPDQYECYNLASSKMYTMVDVAEKVKEVYKEKYQKDVQVNVTGTEPATTNNFYISLDKLEKIGFTEDGAFTLETEISEIFNYLKSNNKK